MNNKIGSYLNLLEFQARQQMERTEKTLLFVGCFGIVGHIGWYIYWKLIYAQNVLVYDSLPVRILGVLSSIVLLFLATKKLKCKYAGLLCTVILAYNLPFVETFFLFKKTTVDPSLLAYQVTFLTTILIFSVLTTLVTFLLFTLLSILFATALYITTTAHPALPSNLPSIIDVGIYILVFCIIFSYENHKYYTNLIGKLKNKIGETFHEVNNLFSGIILKLDWWINIIKTPDLLTRPEQENLTQDLIVAKKQAQSSANLLSVLSGNLDEKTKKQKQQFEKRLITDIVHEAITICPWPTASLKQHIHINDKQKFTVHAPSVMVRHIIINIIRNALREIQKHGYGEIFMSCITTQTFNILVIKDTVGSLSKENTEVIFKRGFSTYQNGFGFGLAFCYESMEYLGGAITCTTEHKTTTFQLYFPKA